MIGGIQNNVGSLNRIQHSIYRNTQRISTGTRHPYANFDPAAYSIAQRTYSNIGAIDQSNQNTQNTNSMLQTASGAIGNSIDALSSFRQTLLQAANGTNNPQDLATLQKTMNQTIQAINDNATSATFNGKQLLNGNNSFAVAGIDGYQNVTLGNMTAQGLGLTDAQGNPTVNVAADNFQQPSPNQPANPTPGQPPTTNIQDMLNTVDNALNNALDQATTVGAQQERLSYQSANYTTMEEGLQGQVSIMDDTDLAKRITELHSAQTQQQFALYGQRMNNYSRGSILRLLQ